MNDIEKIMSQLERQKAAIEKAITALRDVSGLGVDESKTTKATEPKTTRRKSHISPEGRKRIAEATRKRWAAKRAAEKTAAKISGSANRTRPVKKKVA